VKIGSLATGFGGLDAAVVRLTGGELAWVADNDPGVCQLLALRYPGVKNLGDVSVIDWSTVEPVDVIVSGWPCQNMSAAGLRDGMMPGNRSGLWFDVIKAITALRPPLAVLENVRGVLSAKAHRAGSDVEPCPVCMGNHPENALRALGAVVGDLSAIGYDSQWEAVRASEAGAPHRRDRIFVLAWPAYPSGQ
jgi:DNA (cytosine-5)-methyltransferase 1